MVRLLKRFARDARGATAIEYAIIAGMLSIGILAGVQAVGGEAKSQYEDINTAVNEASS